MQPVPGSACSQCCIKQCMKLVPSAGQQGWSDWLTKQHLCSDWLQHVARFFLTNHRVQQTAEQSKCITAFDGNFSTAE